jgi:hypothetical protein
MLSQALDGEVDPDIKGQLKRMSAQTGPMKDTILFRKDWVEAKGNKRKLKSWQGLAEGLMEAHQRSFLSLAVAYEPTRHYATAILASSLAELTGTAQCRDAWFSIALDHLRTYIRLEADERSDWPVFDPSLHGLWQYRREEMLKLFPREEQADAKTSSSTGWWTRLPEWPWR